MYKIVLIGSNKFFICRFFFILQVFTQLYSIDQLILVYFNKVSGVSNYKECLVSFYLLNQDTFPLFRILGKKAEKEGKTILERGLLIAVVEFRAPEVLVNRKLNRMLSVKLGNISTTKRR